MPRTHAPLALLLAATLTLTGCATTPKHLDKAGTGSPPPAAASAPFASEDEALAAAVEVYARYTQIGDQIGQDGGRDAGRLSEVMTGSFLDQSVEGLASWEQKQWRQIGSATFRDEVLQQYSVGPADAVIIFLCQDISEVQVVDSLGRSVVAPGRRNTSYFQVTFDLNEDGQLLVSGRLLWDERSC